MTEKIFDGFRSDRNTVEDFIINYLKYWSMQFNTKDKSDEFV